MLAACSQRAELTAIDSFPPCCCKGCSVAVVVERPITWPQPPTFICLSSLVALAMASGWDQYLAEVQSGWDQLAAEQDSPDQGLAALSVHPELARAHAVASPESPSRAHGSVSDDVVSTLRSPTALLRCPLAPHLQEMLRHADSQSDAPPLGETVPGIQSIADLFMGPDVKLHSSKTVVCQLASVSFKQLDEYATLLSNCTLHLDRKCRLSLSRVSIGLLRSRVDNVPGSRQV